MKRPFPFHSNVVWPPPILVGAFVVIYAAVYVSFWLLELSVVGKNVDVSNMPEVITFRAMVLAFVAGVYALYRLLRFHPACNWNYAAWLKLSPWTADRPLPAGPVHLVWQDAAVVGMLAAIGAWNHVNALWPVAAFIFVYLGGFTLLLAFTRRWGACFILGLLWPSLMLPGVAPIARQAPGLPAIAIVIAIACVIWFGHRQSLKAFPWEFIKVPQRSLLDAQIRIPGPGTASAAGTQYNIGWPYLVLSPKVRPPAVSHRTTLALGALAGWWSFCLIKAASTDPDADMSVVPGVILFFAIIAALTRLVAYGARTAPPFNIWGRIATGRIVVPGFDRIFVTPIAVVIGAIIGGAIIKHSGAWYAVADSIVIAVLWCILFGGGPTLRNWALTGQFRLRPPAIAGANKQSVRQV